MATSKAQAHDGDALYLKGRTIKAHIDSAKKHQEKFDNHCKSAGILLIEAKGQVNHGEWLSWLDEHGINRRTATRLMGEQAHPERVEARRTDNRERMAEARAEPNETHNGSFAEAAPKQENKERDTPKPEPARKAEVKDIRPARAVKLVRKLNAEQLMKVIAFIMELLGEGNE